MSTSKSDKQRKAASKSTKPQTVSKKDAAVELSPEDLNKVTGGAQVDFRKG